jgi:hypothetical protein
MNEAQFKDCNNIQPRHGITSTPVIDPKRKTIYVCGVTQPGIRQVYQVWGLDLQTGAVKPGWPVTLKGSYKGLAFDGGQLTQRGALNLVRGWLVELQPVTLAEVKPGDKILLIGSEGKEGGMVAKTVILGASPIVGFGG